MSEVFSIGACYLLLGIGIGIQNFPEGFSINATKKDKELADGNHGNGDKCLDCWSIFTVIGKNRGRYTSITYITICSYFQQEMIFIVVEEVIPESQSGGHTGLL